MSKPVIGIVLDRGEKKTSEGGYSDRPWYALRVHYAEAVAAKGGIPVHISYEHNLIKDYIALCSGFIIAGWEYDIDPAYYKEKVSPKTKLASSNVRTEFELKLLKAILQQKTPLLGICNGHQLLNVALGGTLHQDLNTNIQHKHISNQVDDSHDIVLSSGSMLRKIFNKQSCKVNSNHHQAVNKLGKNLIVSAVAPDGVIEAIEHKHLPFCVGVEWHPEYQKNDQDKKLMKAFVNAAKKACA